MSTNLIISILATSVLFTIFKFFEKYKVVSLNAIIVNYLIASALAFVIPDETKPLSYILEQTWFPVSIFLGFLFVVLFQIMAYSSQKIDISTTTIANKITFIFPTIMGIILFNEPWSFLKLIGFGIAVASIILSAENRRKFPKKRAYFILLILFLGGGFLESLLSYSQQRLINRSDTSVFFGYLFLFAFVFGLIIFFWRRSKGESKISKKDFLWGIILGIPNYFSMYFLLESLKDLHSSVVFPIANMGVILCSTLLSVLLFHEKLSKKKLLAVFSSIVAILLISFHDIF